MFHSRIPILFDDLDKSFLVFNKTWTYLLDQAQANLDFVFDQNEQQMNDLLEFLKEWHGTQNQKKVIYAAAGRSLFMGAKILAQRMSMLGFNMDYPHAEVAISAPPSSRIDRGDCLFAFTSSGTTKSVVAKANFTRSQDGKTIIITANPKSKVTEGGADLIIHLPSNRNAESLKKGNEEYIFSPLGTNSEFSSAILAETLGRGLKEVILDNASIETGMKVMKSATGFILLFPMTR